jgi:hypothetical protein
MVVVWCVAYSVGTYVCGVNTCGVQQAAWHDDGTNRAKVNDSAGPVPEPVQMPEWRTSSAGRYCYYKEF